MGIVFETNTFLIVQIKLKQKQSGRKVFHVMKNIELNFYMNSLHTNDSHFNHKRLFNCRGEGVSVVIYVNCTNNKSTFGKNPKALARHPIAPHANVSYIYFLAVVIRFSFNTIIIIRLTYKEFSEIGFQLFP